MKAPFVVSIFLVLLVSCTEKTPRDTPETGETAVGQEVSGRIYKAVDGFMASDATIQVCADDDTAKWVRQGDAQGKEIRIQFSEAYHCILSPEYSFPDKIEIIIKKNDFCTSCDSTLQAQILAQGIPAHMSIKVGQDFVPVDGENSPPRIIIGNPGTGLVDECCPE